MLALKQHPRNRIAGICHIAAYRMLKLAAILLTLQWQIYLGRISLSLEVLRWSSICRKRNRDDRVKDLSPELEKWNVKCFSFHRCGVTWWVSSVVCFYWFPDIHLLMYAGLWIVVGLSMHLSGPRWWIGVCSCNSVHAFMFQQVFAQILYFSMVNADDLWQLLVTFQLHIHNYADSCTGFALCL